MDTGYCFYYGALAAVYRPLAVTHGPWNVRIWDVLHLHMLHIVGWRLVERRQLSCAIVLLEWGGVGNIDLFSAEDHRL